MMAADLHSILVDCAKHAGFALAGALDLEPIPEHVAKYDEWLASGFAGAMEYLVRGRDRRADPKIVFPEAKSILCVALPYAKSAAGARDAATGARYARYLQGPDYHEDLSARMEQAMKEAAKLFAAETGRELRWKSCVDTSAVLERSWAALAGLGWIGKNTMLIHPKLGSYLFLGAVLVSEPVGRGPAPLPNLCGHCTKCLSACPTQAIVRPHSLDSRQCISYLTLEKRGNFGVEPSTLSQLGSWVAGCDVCQEVCPFNFKPTRENQPEAESPNATELQSWSDLLDESEVAYRERVKNSALSRIKPPQFRRNLARALNNAARANPKAFVSLLPRVHTRIQDETDASALEQWQACARSISEA